MANYGNLAKEQPLVVDLSIAPWWLISVTLYEYPLVADYYNLAIGHPLVAD